MIEFVLHSFADFLGPISFMALVVTAFANVIMYGKLNVTSDEYHNTK